MRTGHGTLADAMVVAAVLWHLAVVYAGGWGAIRTTPHANDFASFYYAARVAWRGDDPYVTASLHAEAKRDAARSRTAKLAAQRPRSEGGYATSAGLPRGLAALASTRPAAEVPVPYPFLYPPAFLVLMGWTLPLSLSRAYRLWFVASELSLCLALLCLCRWWRPLGRGGWRFVVVAALLLPATVENHIWGQMNLPTLALAMLGLWLVERAPSAPGAGRWRAVAGGALLGLACHVKMAPALFVVWWLRRSRVRPALAALVTVVLLSLLAWVVLGLDIQKRFLLAVLPRLFVGDFNGLGVPLDSPANQSLAGFLQHVLAAGAGQPSRLVLWLASGGGMLAAALAIGRRPDPTCDPFSHAASVAAVALAMLLIPGYCFEHHLVWAIAPLALSAIALDRGRLARRWALPVGASWALLMLPLGLLQAPLQWKGHKAALDLMLREARLAGLILLLALMLWLAWRQPSAAPRSGPTAR
ncbi:MAG: DUF2029 domain-containing protein [Deltaproteobacteria bacterium]|nr:DUF2029 domain-containing protein [Deltaproteobacteria bacterium]